MGGRLLVEISIDEGRIFKIGRIGFKNSMVFTERQLIDFFPLKSGESAVGFQEKIREGLEILKRSYENHGYLNWVPVPRQEILEDEAVLNITFDMEEGPTFIVRRILLTGVEDPLESTVRSQLVLQEGQPFSWAALEESFRRVETSGLAAFVDRSSVEIRPNHSSQNVEVVIPISSHMNAVN
jgi:outer membrane protein assembly factor BamA